MIDPFKKFDFICYIDEAGDEGFEFEKGSSEWFILSALVNTGEKDEQIISTVDKVKLRIEWPLKKQLHWRDLRALEKEYYIGEIAKLPLKVVIVAVYKPAIKEKEKFQNRYLLYFYTVRYLLERVSWLIRELHSKTNQTQQIDGNVNFVFSYRAAMSYDELKNYLGILKKQFDYGKDIRVEWRYVVPERVWAFPPGRAKGLQLVDAIAGAFYNALEKVKTKRQRTDFALTVKPLIYKYKGKVSGYGLKIVPREAQDLLEHDESYKWLKEFK